MDHFDRKCDISQKNCTEWIPISAVLFIRQTVTSNIFSAMLKWPLKGSRSRMHGNLSETCLNI